MRCKYYKPEFEQLREDCKNFYKFDGCGSGGPLHILLDDDNFHDSDIVFCMGACLDKEDYKVTDEAAALGLIICAKYAKLSMPERAAFDSFWCGEKLDCADHKNCEVCSIMSLLE